MSDFQDSGTRRDFDTGSVRDAATDKGRFDLMPFDGLQAVARIFEKGCMKYGERNWEKGQPLHVYLDSGIRHALKYASGHRDEPHLAMACWNFLCLIQTEQWIQDGKLPDSLQTIPSKDWRPSGPVEPSDDDV